jgi:hypothetical protein
VAPRSTEELLAAAELVFEGTVVATEVRPAQDGRRIHTLVRFAVADVLKGSAPLGEITLRYLGGRSGSRRLEVAGMEVPALGERGLWFVESTTRPLVHPLVGWEQGCLLIEADARGRDRLRTRSGAAVVAVDLAPPFAPLEHAGEAASDLVVRHGAPLEDALPAAAFKRWLRARLAEEP